MEKEQEKFDYAAAVAELEAIAARVEDPKTPVEDMEAMIRRSVDLIAACRAYLRGAREKVEQMDRELS
ncbi:MAG: exodeoxyribonuclease VII small subunit [Candidatus Cryptobacteroides sp.]